MSTFIHWLKRWGPALLIMAVIFAASSRAKYEIPDFGLYDLLVKKSGHFFIYALLGLAYLRGLAGGRRPRWRDVAASVALAALYGASDEFHQGFVPGRGARLLDVLIDTTGAGVGLGLCLAWQRWAPPALRSRRVWLRMPFEPDAPV